MQQNTRIYRLLSGMQTPYFFISYMVFVIISFLYIDKPLALTLHQLDHTTLYNIANTVTKLGLGGTYIIGFFALWILTRWLMKKPELAKKFFYLFSSVLLSGLICDAVKMLLGRARPTELFHHQLYGFYFLQTKSDMWSFPSGHATTIASVMIALALLLPRWWWAFALVALTVCLSRVVVTAHFLSDVMVGFYLGSMTAKYLYDYFFVRIAVHSANTV